ncbi:MAG: GNAT family N-acetyltransferase [Bryobacteraceae bacterium]
MPETGPNTPSATTQTVQILAAEQKDIPLILTFIRKLAEYEKLQDHVVADEDSLRKALFGPRPAAEVLLAYVKDKPVGFAVYFQTFSTFMARSGIYLEDLFIEPAFRSKGVGTAVLIHLARVAVQRGCARLSWAVLDWNQPAIQFYRKLGAIPLDEWTVFELSGTALDSLTRSDLY